MEKTLVIIPTYNEKENIEAITSSVLVGHNKVDVLIIDDNSPDGTGQIADKLSHENQRIHVLHRQKKNGLGRAYIAGFKWVLERDYEFVFEMDADFSHDPKYISLFLEKIKKADLVIGSRYLSGVNVINWPMSRLLISYFANRFARIVTGLPICDATSGFKCFRRRVLENLNLDSIGSEGYSFQIEVNFMTWKLGFKISELPIVFYDRQKGTSKMSSKIVREASWLLWKMRVLNLFKPIRPVIKPDSSL
jgi:dolichol-phosphate mannosyltransferase